ncbi:MAG: hypothetical protein FJ403_00570 [Verrucomicrobia bacterium]|nr:hypothetical protein [Verrucomicrobiota bacterium]
MRELSEPKRRKRRAPVVHGRNTRNFVSEKSYNEPSSCSGVSGERRQLGFFENGGALPRRRYREKIIGPDRYAVLFAIALVFWGRGFAQESGATPPPSPWNNIYNIRSWAGYKDNVLLGNRSTVDNAFVAGGLDALLWRMPVNGCEYFFFGTADYLRYFPGDEVNKELTAIAQAQVKRHFNDGWRTGLSLDYVYFDQVFDNSTFEREQASIQVQAHSLTLRPSVRKEIAKHWFELEFPITRQDFREFIDDYWEGGPKLIWGRKYSEKSEISVSYEFNNRFHDTREIRDAQGGLAPGTNLEFQQHEVFASLRHYWDKAQRWRTLARIGLERNDDNGSGYYDYWRPQLTQQVRYQTKVWEVKSEARLSYYDYDSQPLSDVDPSTRHRLNLILNLRGERTLFKSLKCFAEYEHERSISNLGFDEYKVNTIMGGVDWGF